MVLMHTLIQPACVASGALVAFLVGLTGVGGGPLTPPLLVLLFGVHPSTAVGTEQREQQVQDRRATLQQRPLW
jgi:uncharacterized membrane protein YfcA